MTASVHLGERLKTVNCSSRGLSSVPRGIMFDAETLVLSSNRLVDLHEQLPSLDHLLHLDISNNRLKQLGRGHIFMNFTRLRYMDLSQNEFRTLFAGVFRGLKRLEVLLLTDGSLRYIDEHAFDGLENLRVLDLRGNHITSVYLELFQSILNLHILNLSKNSISHLTGGIFASLNGLRRLDMSQNQITGINDNAFVGLDMLEEMHLRANFLSHVPSVALQSLKRLRTLDIGVNAFQQLQTGDFVHSAVEELAIDHCVELTMIDRGAFWDLPNLRILRVHSNPSLVFIDSQAFLGVPSLSQFFAHNNSLLTVQEEMVNTIVHGQQQTQHHSSSSSSLSLGASSSSSFNSHRLKLAVHLNPFLCDCNIKYLYQCLQNGSACKVDLVSPDDIRCSEPASLRKLKVSELQLWPLVANDIHPLTTTAAMANHSALQAIVKDTCLPTLLVTAGPTNGTVHRKIGERHVFQCRALGSPTPRIHWLLPSGEVLNESTSSIHMQLKLPGNLKMLHLKPRDTGQYTCVATNSVGQVAKFQVLSVDNIDLHIWPLGVSSTFVTVVWNGTARNSFPEYQILYRMEESVEPMASASSSDSVQQQQLPGKYEAVTVSHFLRSYTISHLEPLTKYKLCIAVKDDDSQQLTSGGFLQLSCTSVTTQGHEFMVQGVQHTSNLAIALACLSAIVMGLSICMAFMAARRYRHRTQYHTPEKTLLDSERSFSGHAAMAGLDRVAPAGHCIPLEDIYSPLMP
ncbi:Leucine-rich repeat neuronal protein 1 [Halotydeus destructor]|nr:Leucine-rich repeat neuronal protein 1 [Halotydeus destructor]